MPVEREELSVPQPGAAPTGGSFARETMPTDIPAVHVTVEDELPSATCDVMANQNDNLKGGDMDKLATSHSNVTGHALMDSATWSRFSTFSHFLQSAYPPMSPLSPLFWPLWLWRPF